MGGLHGPKAGVLRLLAALGALTFGHGVAPALGDEPPVPPVLPPPKSRVLPRAAPPAAPVPAPPGPPSPLPPAPPRPPARPGAQPGAVKGSDEEPLPAPDPDGLVTPTPRPPRPPGSPKAAPEDLEFHVERPGGVLKRFPDADGSAAWVMVGNPRVFGQAHTRKDGRQVEALSIKANRMVA